MLSIWSSITDTLSKWGKWIQDFFVNNYENPVLWILLFLGGLFFCSFIFSTLNNKNR